MDRTAGRSPQGGRVAFVLKGYPRLSETFIAQEIRGLEARGLVIDIVSLRHPTDTRRHPIHDEIAADILYLPEYLWQEPFRVLRGWLAARRTPGWRAARAAWWRDLLRDPTPNRVRRFGQACVLAAEMPAGTTWLHAHFLHTPASVTRYAAMMTGLPFSISAHAVDIWTTPDWDKAEKLADCQWVTTCSQAGQRALAALAPGQPPDLIYHGLDLGRFPPRNAPASMRDGSDAADPVVILAVGRAVPKKGFDGLIDALAALPAGLHWRLVHIGGGDGRKALKHRAEKAGIADRIDWRGSQSQDAVLAAYRGADLFVLPSRIAANGDRDGLPNVLMEAQSQALACVATTVSGIPELIEDGKTGMLVPPDDAAALAAALADLIVAPDRRQALGQAGEWRVRTAFDCDAGLDRIAARFGIARAEAAE